MPQKPYKFKNEEELVDKFRSKKNCERAREFFNQRFEDIATIVEKSVVGNTFRAFRISEKGNRPSDVFRESTKIYIERTLKELCNISEKGGYADYVHIATDELCTIWQKRMEAKLGYGRASKLLNLVFKGLACYSDIDDTFREKLIRWLHVPLDSYTIVGLKNLLSTPSIPSIPASATMKFVTNRDQYFDFQEYISFVAQKAKVPPIYYEILAWDSAHSKK
jgi:hypothetical protein